MRLSEFALGLLLAVMAPAPRRRLTPAPVAPPAPPPPALCKAPREGSVVLELTPDGDAYLLGARHAYQGPARAWAWSLLDLWPGTLDALERRVG